MTRQAAMPYCSEHMAQVAGDGGGGSGDAGVRADPRGRRVPCPLDPRHTVWERDVARHTRRCNRAKEAAEQRARALDPAAAPWYAPGLNAQVASENDAPVAVAAEVAHAANAAVLRALPVLRRVYAQHFADRPLPLQVRADDGVVQRRFPQLANRKHAVQQASLIQHMREAGLLESAPAAGATTFIEFGCGRAELSRYVSQSVAGSACGSACGSERGSERGPAPAPPPCFVLVDRASNRMKFDSKFAEDWAAIRGGGPAPRVCRRKVDIRDLRIDALLEPGAGPAAAEPAEAAAPGAPAPADCVAISKHLCGVATDLTLACVLNSRQLHAPHRRLRGMVIAMCCRHVCDARQYANPEFIRGLIAGDDVGYPEFFLALKKIASWAVCGRRAGVADHDVSQHFTGLPVVQREQLGEMARRIIDEGRAQLLRDRGYAVSLVRYVGREVSLENVAMVVKERT